MGPLFGGVPGGPELVIFLLMLLLMLVVPIAFAVGLFLLGRWSASRGRDASEDRLGALQERVDELEARLEAENAVEASAETDGQANDETDGQSEGTD